MYNYHAAIKEDITNAIKEYIECMDANEREGFYQLDEDGKYEELDAYLWVDDSVTGNASGSYFCNTWKAEEAISHNWELLKEAADTFGEEAYITCEYDHGAEWWDVTIRCYLLSQILPEVIAELF